MINIRTYRIDTVYNLYDKYVQEWIDNIDELECDALCNGCECESDCENKLLSFDGFRGNYEDMWRD